MWRSIDFQGGVIQLEVVGENSGNIVWCSSSSVDAGSHGPEALRIERVGVVQNWIDKPAGGNDGDSCSHADPERRY